MRKLVLSLSVVGLVAAGTVATEASATPQTHTTPTSATSVTLDCAQPVNPTLREIVNTVCRIFGP